MVLFIPNTSNIHFYDNCRYTQTQVFYNLPYISNYIINDLRINAEKYNFKLFFLQKYKQKHIGISELLSVANISLVSPVYLASSHLSHTIYYSYANEYYNNLTETLKTVANSKNYLVHLMYDSKLLAYTNNIYFSNSLSECMVVIIPLLSTTAYLFIGVIVDLCDRIRLFIYNIYVSYCRYISFIILSSGNGYTRYLSTSFDTNQNLL